MRHVVQLVLFGAVGLGFGGLGACSSGGGGGGGTPCDDAGACDGGLVCAGGYCVTPEGGATGGSGGSGGLGTGGLASGGSAGGGAGGAGGLGSGGTGAGGFGGAGTGGAGSGGTGGTDPCVTCAQASCATELQTCANSTCQTILTCLGGCGASETCANACYDNNPDGQEAFDDLLGCMYTYCETECF
ncbi:MAG: hypothetical protein KF718_02300 [Polyangiaceae bacterium]|nr:hypothetical protein [Polyangiaceae bacterium]